MKLQPSGERSSCSMPRLTTAVSPGRSTAVSEPIVISTSPSVMSITCSVCSWECRLTTVPGSYFTRHISTCSPPIESTSTVGKIRNGSVPFQLRNGEAVRALLIHELEPVAVPAAAHSGNRSHGVLLVEDDALALAARLAALVERAQDALGRRGALVDPDADRVVNRGADGRRLRVVRHLADRLRAE